LIFFAHIFLLQQHKIMPFGGVGDLL